jgi:uncharacterized membrane protein YgaE (UPF0421/DUF939 family)
LQPKDSSCPKEGAILSSCCSYRIISPTPSTTSKENTTQQQKKDIFDIKKKAVKTTQPENKKNKDIPVSQSLNNSKK